MVETRDKRRLELHKGKGTKHVDEATRCKAGKIGKKQTRRARKRPARNSEVKPAEKNIRNHVIALVE